MSVPKPGLKTSISKLEWRHKNLDLRRKNFVEKNVYKQRHSHKKYPTFFFAFHTLYKHGTYDCCLCWYSWTQCLVNHHHKPSSWSRKTSKSLYAFSRNLSLHAFSRNLSLHAFISKALCPCETKWSTVTMWKTRINEGKFKNKRCWHDFSSTSLHFEGGDSYCSRVYLFILFLTKPWIQITDIFSLFCLLTIHLKKQTDLL